MSKTAPVVTIDQGTLKGSTAVDIRRNTFCKFQGIPYAKPPVGNLRFKAPLPPEKWVGVLDATREGDVCYQRDFLRNKAISGSENCLVLNVYTKKLPRPEDELRPVLFWIHGGGYVFGSGSQVMYGPDFLVTENVVLVTINYRLGLLGFLSLEDPTLDIPGNAALKDQVMALKWVQKNIDKFGGDPNNVTIFGESAGAAFVHLLMLSPMSRGLFHKAIAQSGCALNPWVQGVRGGKVVAAAMGLEGADDRTIYSALMQKSAKEIFDIQEKIEDRLLACERKPFGVVIEKNSMEPFLEQEPMTMVLSGDVAQVPLMMGYTVNEGTAYELLKKPELPEMPPIESTIPWYFGYENGTPKTQAIAEKIKAFYFGDKEFSQKTLVEKYNLLTDAHFLHGLYVTVTSHINNAKTPVYLYKLVLETKLNFFKNLLDIKVPGAYHCDDIGYLFKNFTTPHTIRTGSVEDISLRKFLRLWSNFAKFGNPTPEEYDPLLQCEWKPVTDSNLDYLNIAKTLTPMSNPDSERIQFWNELFSESPARKITNGSS